MNDGYTIPGLLRRVQLVEVDDSGTQQRLRATGLAGEEFSNVVRAQHFGLSSVPPKGAEGLLLAQGGRSDRAHILGLEHKDYRPTKTEAGGTVIYDGNGQAISLVKRALRIVGTDTITIKATRIVIDGEVYLGGADADKEAAMRGSIDSAGHTEQSNLATRVFLK